MLEDSNSLDAPQLFFYQYCSGRKYCKAEIDQLFAVKSTQLYTRWNVFIKVTARSSKGKGLNLKEYNGWSPTEHR